MHHLAALPDARSISTLHRAPRKFYSCTAATLSAICIPHPSPFLPPPARCPAARTVNRRRWARCRQKPNYHKYAPQLTVWQCPVHSPNVMPENDLRTADPALACAFNRQSAGAEIPFLCAKIPFPAPMIARIPPAQRPPAKLFRCPLAIEIGYSGLLVFGYGVVLLWGIAFKERRRVASAACPWARPCRTGKQVCPCQPTRKKIEHRLRIRPPSRVDAAGPQ